MGIEKKYLKDKSTCKVTFTLGKDAANGAQNACVAGDFNGWDAVATPMKKLKNGAFKATVELESGREHQYRFLLDGTMWANDGAADKYVPTPYGDCDNCVVVT